MSKKTSAVALLFVAAISFSIGAAPQDRQDNANTILKELHAERVAMLTFVRDYARMESQTGRVTPSELLGAENELNAAKLDAASTKKERLVFLRAHVRLFGSAEQRAEAQHRVGLLLVTEVKQATAARLKAEIDLLTEGMK